MGSEISVINETEFALNIAIKQVSPLYYENNVMPGQTITRDVGKVHFTIEARIYNGTNGYADIDSVKKIGAIVGVTVAVPAAIVGAAFIPTKIVAGSVVSHVVKNLKDATKSAAPQVVMVATSAMRRNKTTDSAVTKRTNQTGTEFSVPAEWCIRACVNSKGWYMNTDKHFAIRGGPTENNRLRPFEVVCLTET